MDSPQFQKAEYGGASQPSCQICKQPVGAAYYRVNGALACEQCAARVKNSTPESGHANFMRGLIFGIGGAVLGLILYSAFTIVTGIYLGYIALAVGYIVGKAIKMGSKGFGGAHYQIAAVLLTYAAVSMSAVPIAISYAVKHRSETPRVHTATPSIPTTANPANTNSDGQSTSSAPGPNSASGRPAAPAHKSVLLQLASLAFIGLASPFLDFGQDPVHGGIGFLLLLIAMSIAWRLTAMSDHAQIVGPFKNEGAAATAPPPSLG